MTQQPILTADEVLEMLKEALPENERSRLDILAPSWKHPLYYVGFKPPSDEVIALLQHCANFLRSKGIFVFFDFSQAPLRPRYYRFIAGECGRVFEKLRNQAEYLSSLLEFIEAHKSMLPTHMVAKKRKIDAYIDKIVSSFLWVLADLYTEGDKEALKTLCEEAWKFAEEVDAYLESIEDLRHLHALATTL